MLFLLGVVLTVATRIPGNDDVEFYAAIGIVALLLILNVMTQP